MNDRTKPLSLGAIWEETFGFVRAEAGLLAPLALLGFALPMVVFQLVQPEKLVVNGQVVTGPWMFWAIPHFLLSLLGTFSIAALALNPGMSVRESLSLAVSRLPAGIAVALIGMGAFIVATTLFLAAASLDMNVAGQPGPIAVLVFLAMLSIFVFVAVRLLPVWTVLIYRPGSPVAAIRETLRLTRRRYARLLLLRILAVMGEIAVAFVLLTPISLAFDLVGRATGAVPISMLFALLVGSALAAGMATIWTVYVARLTVWLSGPSDGI